MTKVRVTGHRLDNRALLSQPQLRRLPSLMAHAFAEAVNDEAGVEVSEMIGGGKWWTSRHPRFAKYRSWVRQAYGSDRRRKLVGSRGKRTAENPNPDGLTTPDEMNDWGNVQHLMTQWISRQLARDMREVTVGEHTGATKRRYYVTSVKGGGTPVDVTSAVLVLQRLADQNSAAKLQGRADSRDVRMRNLQDALNHGGMQDLRTSRYGQRLYRMAYQAAQRQLKARHAAQAESGGAEKKPKARSNTGGYKWGVQTGQLRDAWGNPHYKLSLKASGKLRITVFPNQSGDMVKTGTGLRSLTKMLVRQRRGPKRLITKDRARRIVRRAVKTSLADLQTQGLPVRLKKG